jgi:hypothetical protein
VLWPFGLGELGLKLLYALGSLANFAVFLFQVKVIFSSLECCWHVLDMALVNLLLLQAVKV